MAMLTEYPVFAKNLTCKAGFKTIIDNISVVLKRNEFVGLIGGSGSGKTTLLTCLNGFRARSAGTLRLNGIPIDDKERIQHLVGYVPQDDIVHKTLTVESALYYACQLRMTDVPSEEKIRNRIQNVLNALDLKEHKNKKILKLSGGQRKRVNIGVELLHSPRLFFLDEPSSGLDPSLERQLMYLLRSLADDERVVVITTHMMQNVELFDLLIFIHKGQMIYFGPSDQITAFFKVKDMIDLFDKIILKDPIALKNQYLRSPLHTSILAPRLATQHDV